MAPILPRGIYAPTLTFYHDDAQESVDTEMAAQHALRLAKAGLAGVVLQGSTGEAVHLTREERMQIITAVRKKVDGEGFKTFKVVAGTGGQSNQETKLLCQDAKNAGADAGIILPPAYFSGQMTPDVLRDYFLRVADESPLPFLIYNFPGVTNGINMSGDFLASVAHHPNIIGAKLTCNTIGKMTYLSPYAGNLPKSSTEFNVYTGGSDFLIAGHAAGISGAITGMSNTFPYTMVKLWELLEAGDIKEAQQIQAVVTRAEVKVVPGFIPVARSLLRQTAGYGGRSRSPLQEVEAQQERVSRADIDEIWGLEQKLAKLN